jgi:hypothetical protein
MRSSRASLSPHPSIRPASARSRRLLAGLGALGLVAGLTTVVTAGALPASAAVTGSSDPITFGYTGSRTAVTVPQGTQMAFIQATGGSGGDASGATGGFGATVDGAFYVTPGEQLQIAVGQAGLNGAPGWGSEDYFGGAPGASGWSNSDGPVDAGGGGGATVVYTPSGPVILAGGGGGAGARAHCSDQYPDEPAGGDGGSGGATPTGGATGAGGTQDGAGLGGAGGGSTSASGGAGAAAVTTQGCTFGQGGGGGGGSALGGAGGGVGSGDMGFGGGGGGGGGQSSTATSVFDTSVATAASAGNGSVTLYWISGVSITAAPLPATVTASTTPHPLSISAVDSSGESLPDPSSYVTWSSSDPTDTFSSAGVAMTHVGTHTITATWNGDPSLTSSFQVSVVHGPLVALEFVTPTPAYRTVPSGTQVDLGVEGVDAWGNLVGDATSYVTFSSSVPSDVFSTEYPSVVTVTAPGTHVITASYPGFGSPTLDLTVTASSSRLGTTPPPSGSRHGALVGTGPSSGSSDPAVAASGTADLAATGGSAPVASLVVGLATMIAGLVLCGVALQRSRRRRS